MWCSHKIMFHRPFFFSIKHHIISLFFLLESPNLFLLKTLRVWITLAKTPFQEKVLEEGRRVGHFLFCNTYPSIHIPTFHSIAEFIFWSSCQSQSESVSLLFAVPLLRAVVRFVTRLASLRARPRGVCVTSSALRFSPRCACQFFSPFYLRSFSFPKWYRPPLRRHRLYSAFPRIRISSDSGKCAYLFVRVLYVECARIFFSSPSHCFPHYALVTFQLHTHSPLGIFPNKREISL